jgi:hypothetical protein
MSGEADGLALAAQVVDELGDDLAAQDVEAEGRLVQEQDGGPVDQGAGEVDALLLPGERPAARPRRGPDSRAQGV